MNLKQKIGIGALAVSLAASANANERLFTYSYEPETMPQGGWEVEQWVTLEAGRNRTVGQEGNVRMGKPRQHKRRPDGFVIRMSGENQRPRAQQTPSDASFHHPHVSIVQLRHRQFDRYSTHAAPRDNHVVCRHPRKCPLP